MEKSKKKKKNWVQVPKKNKKGLEFNSTNIFFLSAVGSNVSYKMFLYLIVVCCWETLHTYKLKVDLLWPFIMYAKP